MTMVKDVANEIMARENHGHLVSSPCLLFCMIATVCNRNSKRSSKYSELSRYIVQLCQWHVLRAIDQKLCGKKKTKLPAYRPEDALPLIPNLEICFGSQQVYRPDGEHRRKNCQCRRTPRRLRTSELAGTSGYSGPTPMEHEPLGPTDDDEGLVESENAVSPTSPVFREDGKFYPYRRSSSCMLGLSL